MKQFTMDILVKIFTYAFGAFIVLGVLGLFLILVRVGIALLKGKAPEFVLPWWIFWSSLHHHDD